GALAAVWVIVFPMLLTKTGAYKPIPLGPRIPLLAAVLCLPAGFALSLLTPVAIKLGLPDVSKTGRVAGLIFALSTLGCLLGNYVTGFYLVPAFYIDTLVLASAAALLVLALGTLGMGNTVPSDLASRERERPEPGEPPVAHAPGSPGTNAHAFPDIRLAFLSVF